MFIFIILSIIALISIIIAICSISQISSYVDNESKFNYDQSNKNENFNYFDYNRDNFIIEDYEIVYEDNSTIMDNKGRVYYKDYNNSDSSTINVSDEKGHIYTVFNHQNQDLKCWYDEEYDNYNEYYEDNTSNDDYYSNSSYDSWFSSKSDEDDGWF